MPRKAPARQGGRWSKLTASEAARAASSTAGRSDLRRPAATCRENPVEAACYRDIRVDRIWEGTSEIQAD